MFSHQRDQPVRVARPTTNVISDAIREPLGWVDWCVVRRRVVLHGQKIRGDGQLATTAYQGRKRIVTRIAVPPLDRRAWRGARGCTMRPGRRRSAAAA